MQGTPYRFCKQWKGISFCPFSLRSPGQKATPFRLLGSSPSPRPTQKCVGRTPCRAWWLPRPGGRLKVKDIAKAGNGVKGKMNTPQRALDTASGFCFWVDKAVKPQCGFTGPVPDFSLFPVRSPVPAQYAEARLHLP